MGDKFPGFGPAEHSESIGVHSRVGFGIAPELDKMEIASLASVREHFDQYHRGKSLTLTRHF